MKQFLTFIDALDWILFSTAWEFSFWLIAWSLQTNDEVKSLSVSPQNKVEQFSFSLQARCQVPSWHAAASWHKSNVPPRCKIRKFACGHRCHYDFKSTSVSGSQNTPRDETQEVPLGPAHWIHTCAECGFHWCLSTDKNHKEYDELVCLRAALKTDTHQGVPEPLNLALDKRKSQSSIHSLPHMFLTST